MEMPGPYKATKLWNEIIRTFRTSMPVGRHRKAVKSYENCFCASDAVHWLQVHLRKNANFGNDVSRQQIVQLLGKFHKSGVFHDVRGPKYDAEPFEDSGRLFKFSLLETTLSPVSAAQRRPLRYNRSFRSPRICGATLSLSSEDCSVTRPPMHSRSAANCRTEAEGGQRSRAAAYGRRSHDGDSGAGSRHSDRGGCAHEADATHLWLGVAMTRLRELLELQSIEDLVDPRQLNGEFVRHNATCVSKSGLVTEVPKSEQLPCWVLNAMRCLSQWPHAAPPGLAGYEGFESDIFAAVAEFFAADPEPLIPTLLYDMFVNVLVLADNLVGRRQCQRAAAPITTSCADMMQQLWSRQEPRHLARSCYSDCEGEGRSARRLRSSASDADGVGNCDAVGIHTIDSDSLLIACLQLATLLLPPPRRRRLRLLLRLMKKMSDNDRLRLDSVLPNHDVVLQTFTACIMRRRAMRGSSSSSSSSSLPASDLFAMQVVAFMTTNYSSVMAVPQEFRDKVDTRAAVLHNLRQRSRKQFCAQLPASEFSAAGRLTSEQALLELLEGILADENLAPKEKRRRLRAFKECHPHVFAARFPDADVEKSVMESLRDRRGVLGRTLAVLRNWRL